MLTGGCAYAAELRLVIVLAEAYPRVVGVDFSCSMPVRLVNRVPLLLICYLQFAVVWVSRYHMYCTSSLEFL